MEGGYRNKYIYIRCTINAIYIHSVQTFIKLSLHRQLTKEYLTRLYQ